MAINNYLENEDIRNQFVEELRNQRQNEMRTGTQSSNENIYHSGKPTNPYQVEIPTIDGEFPIGGRPGFFGQKVDEARRLIEKNREKLAGKLESDEELKKKLSIKNHDDALSVVDEYIDYRISDAGGFPEGDYPEEYRNYVKNQLLEKVLNRNSGLQKGEKNYAPNVYNGITDYIVNKRTAAPAESKDEFIEIAFNPGDTFGQKIIDSGLATDHGLWGEDGDVAYYANQLRENGALSDPNAVDYGQRFTLRKRK